VIRFILAGQAIYKSFRDYHRVPAPLVREQWPDAPAAGTGKQPQLAVAGRTRYELQHRLGVSAGKPLGLSHPTLLLRRRTLLHLKPDGF
jgi:hypothetical protein